MISRHIVSFSFLISLLIPMAFIALASNAAESLSCSPLVLSALPHDAWDADKSYDIDVSKGINNKLNIHITGDIIRLNGIDFTSLLRGKDYAPGNIDNITLDARIVQIEGPLTIEKGNINIYAKELLFERNGAIALTNAPSDSGDSVNINVNELDLRRADSIPLQVSLQYAGRRSIIINANKILFPTFIPTRQTDALTLWQLSSNYLGAVNRIPPITWKVQSGEDGDNTAIKNISTSAEWPSFFAYKVHKYHTYAPFDKNNQQELLARISDITPYMIKLQRADVLLDLNRLVMVINNNTDNRGYGPGVVPSKDFVSAQKDFTNDIANAKQQFQSLINVIISTTQNPKPDKSIIDTARSNLASISNSQSRHETEIGETITALGALQAQAEAITGQIEIQRIESQKKLESLKKRNNDLGNIKAVTTIVAVGASMIGTPAVGAAIAVGVSTAGDMIYAHNIGDDSNIETLATIVQKNSELYSNVTRVRGAWESHHKDLGVLDNVLQGQSITPDGADKPLTRTDAVQRAGKSASEFADAIKSMLSTLGKSPKPDSVSLNQIELENAALQQALSLLVQVQISIAEKSVKLQSLQAALVTDESAQSDAELVEQRLLNVDPVNDVDNRRWRSAAIQLWDRGIRRLYQEAMDLRLSLFYQTWKMPELPDSFSSYPEEIAACFDSGHCKNEILSWSTSDLRNILEYQLDRHLTLLTGFNSAVEDTWESYQSERAAGSQPFFDPQVFSSSNGSPAENKQFINQINAQIRRQIEYPDTRNKPQFRIPIPVTMISPPVFGLPERLLKVGIADPVFRDNAALRGKTVMFDITWPLAGELIYDNKCSRVSLSIPGGQLSKTVRDLANDPVSLLKAQADSPVTLESLMESRTAPPARTSYYLSITIGGSDQDANWNNVPMLDSLTFWRRIVQ